MRFSLLLRERSSSVPGAIWPEVSAGQRAKGKDKNIPRDRGEVSTGMC